MPPNFVLFEDLIGLIRKQDPFLISFFGSHRHTNTHIIFAFQHLNTGASTLLREITTHALCFNSKQMNTMESIWLNYGQLFENFVVTELLKNRFNELKENNFTNNQGLYFYGVYENFYSNIVKFTSKHPEIYQPFDDKYC